MRDQEGALLARLTGRDMAARQRISREFPHLLGRNIVLKTYRQIWMRQRFVDVNPPFWTECKTLLHQINCLRVSAREQCGKGSFLAKR
jgi:hypothetical protein